MKAARPPPPLLPLPHFFSFSPTAGDAAGLGGFSRTGDADLLRLRESLRLRLLRLLLQCRLDLPPRR